MGERTRRLRVVLADDHEAVRQMLQLHLQSADCEIVGQASNGREAIELCEEIQPDLVIMDVMMPIMDGIEATREIKRRWPQIEVLGYSAAAHRQSVEDLLTAGATQNFFKEDYRELIEAVRSLQV